MSSDLIAQREAGETDETGSTGTTVIQWLVAIVPAVRMQEGRFTLGIHGHRVGVHTELSLGLQRIPENRSHLRIPQRAREVHPDPLLVQPWQGVEVDLAIVHNGGAEWGSSEFRALEKLTRFGPIFT